MTRWITSRAGAAILVLAACSPSRSDVTDAGIDVSNDAPAGSNDAPAGSSDAPAGSSDAPAGSSDAPAGSSDAPAGSNDAPAGSNDAPAGSNDAPGDITAPPSDATGSPGDAATSPNDAGNDAPRADGACGDSGRARDAASAPTMPDPDDPTCLVPAPQPACLPGCAPDAAPDESPVLHCERSPTQLLSGAYGSVPRADAQGVYWLAEFGYLRMQRIGTPLGSYEELARADSYTIDDDAVYFGSPSDAGPVTLTRMKRDRTDRVALAEVKPLSTYALDKTSIYFNRVDGKVASVPKSGGTPVDVGLGDIDAGRLQVDDTHFFWVESNGTVDVIKRMAKGTTAIEDLASGIGVGWMQQEGDSLLLFAKGAFLSLPKAGGCPHVLAVPANNVAFRMTSIAADADAIYWMTVFTNTDSPPYTLWRVPRWGGAVVSVVSGTSPPGIIGFGLGPSLVVMKTDGMLWKVPRD